MSEQVRSANRELRWEQIQAAIADLLQEGTTQISLAEIARRCDIPRSSLNKEAVWKAAIASAEAERVRRRTEQLQQLRVGFITPALQAPEGHDPEARRVSLESIVHDLKTLLSEASHDSRTAYERGRSEALAELGPAQADPSELEARMAESFEQGRQAGRSELSREVGEAYEKGHESGREEASLQAAEAFEQGREAGRQESRAALEQAYEKGRLQSSEALNQAYEKGREAGRQESREALAQSFEQGRQAGRSEFQEDLNQAYERGLKDGKELGGNTQEAYERGRQEGILSASAEAKTAYDRGRQMGRAELQVDLKQAYDQGLKDGKTEAAADVMNAYDRGRRDGWEEGRRDAAGGRSMFGFTVNKNNPDREWALAVLHAPPTATLDQLRQAYRSLTKAFHPDRNPDLSPEFIRNLNRAKEILGF